MHFSAIEYSSGGERRHRTFDEGTYGPDYRQLMPLLAGRGYHGILICECHGTQDRDALRMMENYRRYAE